MNKKFQNSFLQSVCQPYKISGRFAWHFALGKLGNDPVFAGILDLGVIPDQARVLDIGCGQGLMAALLCPEHSDWPKNFPRQPKNVSYTGIELMPADSRRGQLGLAFLKGRAKLLLGNMCATDFPESDIVVILDVLHYVNHTEQTGILKRVWESLSINGRLFIRIGDADAGLPFRFSNWTDALITRFRGHKNSKLYCRSLAQWMELLEKIGFGIDVLPMNKGTPFANILIVCTKK